MMSASLPHRLCLAASFNAVWVVCFVWLKNWMCGCFSSSESLSAASCGCHCR